MIADRYQLTEHIGTGGMATVWKARDTLLGRDVAIKRLLPHLADDPKSAERFKREAQAAARLNHPGIVTVFDTGEDEEGPYIILELVEGGTLADRIVESGPLDPGTVVDVVAQVAAALDHAHGLGVVHRDLKPANLIVDSAGRVRLADFGIARTVDDPTTVTATGELIGTISYLAPEILDGRPATPTSDIYSLGAVAYELLAGRPPFTADTPAALLEAVRGAEPPRLSGLASDQMATEVARAMSKDPNRRPATAGLLASALIGSATLVIGSPIRFGAEMSTQRSTSPRQNGNSEAPTVITSPNATRAAPSAADTERVVAVRRWAGWPLIAALVGVLAVAAAALTNDRNPTDDNELREGALPVADSSSTTSTTPTTLATTTSTLQTTTTTAPTTTTIPVPTVEGLASEIGELLASMQPPEFKPKDVERVEDRLDGVMREWEKGDEDHLIDALERAFDAVGELEQSSERDEVNDLLVELTELMGFRVEQGGDSDGGDE